MTVLSKTETSDIFYHEEKNVLTITFKEKICNVSELKSELLNLAAHALENGVKYVLLDNHDLKTPVGKDLQSWAMLNIELPLLNAGVEKFAFVIPKDPKSFALIHTNDTVRKKYFTSLEEAEAWLLS